MSDTHPYQALVEELRLWQQKNYLGFTDKLQFEVFWIKMNFKNILAVKFILWKKELQKLHMMTFKPVFWFLYFSSWVLQLLRHF